MYPYGLRILSNGISDLFELKNGYSPALNFSQPTARKEGDIWVVRYDVSLFIQNPGSGPIQGTYDATIMGLPAESCVITVTQGHQAISSTAEPVAGVYDAGEDGPVKTLTLMRLNEVYRTKHESARLTVRTICPVYGANLRYDFKLDLVMPSWVASTGN